MIHSTNTTSSYLIHGGTDIKHQPQLTGAVQDIIDIVSKMQRSGHKNSDLLHPGHELADKANALQAHEVVELFNAILPKLSGMERESVTAFNNIFTSQIDKLDPVHCSELLSNLKIASDSDAGRCLEDLREKFHAKRFLAEILVAPEQKQIDAKNYSAINYLEDLANVFPGTSVKLSNSSEFPTLEEINSENGGSSVLHDQSGDALIIEKMAVFTKDAIVIGELEQSIVQIEGLLKRLHENGKGKLAKKVIADSGIRKFYHHAVGKNQPKAIGLITQLWRMLLDAEGEGQNGDFGIHTALCHAMANKQHQSLKELAAAVDSLSSRFPYDSETLMAGDQLRALYSATDDDSNGVEARAAAILTIRKYIDMLSKACEKMSPKMAGKLYCCLHDAQTKIGTNKGSYKKLKSIDPNLTQTIKDLKKKSWNMVHPISLKGIWAMFNEGKRIPAQEKVQGSAKSSYEVDGIDLDDLIEEKLLALKLGNSRTALKGLCDVVSKLRDGPEKDASVKKIFDFVRANPTRTFYLQAVHADDSEMIELATKLWCATIGTTKSNGTLGIHSALRLAMELKKPGLIKMLSDAIDRLSSSFSFRAEALFQTEILKKLYSDTADKTTRVNAIASIHEYIAMVKKHHGKLSGPNAKSLAKHIEEARKGKFFAYKSSYNSLAKSNPDLIAKINALCTDLTRTSK